SMMRRMLINYAEARNAAKRQGRAELVALEDALGVFTNPEADLLELNRSLVAARSPAGKSGGTAILRRPFARGDGRSAQHRARYRQARVEHGAALAPAADGGAPARAK